MGLALNIKPSDNSIDTKSLKDDLSQSGTDLLDYLIIVAKHKWQIIGVSVFMSIITALYSLSLPNIYTAKAMFIPGEEDKGMLGALTSQMGGLAGIAGGALGGVTKTEMYLSMLKSETIKDQIIDRFHLMDMNKIKYRTFAYMKLDKIAKISAGKKDGVISITIDDKDPKLAADIANAYVEEIGKMIIGFGMTGAGRNRAFLEKRLVSAKAELVKAEDDLKNFQSKYKAIAVPDQARAAIGEVAQLRAQLAVQEVQLGSLERQYTDSSQEVKSVKTIITNLRRKINALEGGGVNGSIPSIGSVPQLGQEYLRLTREFKIQETVVELLTKQCEIVKINEVKDVVPIQVIQKAKAPDRKSKPSRAKMVIKSAVASGLFMVVLVLALQNFRQMTPEEKMRWHLLKDQLTGFLWPVSFMLGLIRKIRSRFRLFE